MGKQQHDDEIEVVVDLEDLIEWQDHDDEGNLTATPPPPPRGEFEGWEQGEDDLT
ncbi:MAG: hypothetical protein IPJ65_02555 [Archangiaceae bacterium]|nr:hypothetical protein [Archangiaceae bacterium]